MKYVFTFLIVFAEAASAQHMDFSTDGSSSVRPLTQEEQAIKQAASTNDAEWKLQLERPTEFPNGIAIPDSASTNPVWEVGIDGGSLVTWISHASPYDAAAAESNRVAALSERAMLRHDLRVLKGVAQTNKAHVQATVALPAAYTDAENRALVNDLRRELIDANDSIIELTRLVRQLLKEKNP